MKMEPRLLKHSNGTVPQSDQDLMNATHTDTEFPSRSVQGRPGQSGSRFRGPRTPFLLFTINFMHQKSFHVFLTRIEIEFEKSQNSNGEIRNKTFLIHIFSYLGLKEVPKGLTVTQSGVNRDLNSPLLPYSHYTVISQIKVLVVKNHVTVHLITLIPNVRHVFFL